MTEQEATGNVVQEKKYQHYSSSRVATRLITTNGKAIVFANYSFITDDKDCIEYLDAEIESGLNVITKGDLLSHEESDPMVALKRRIIAEHEAAKAKEAKNPSPARAMGNTKTPEQIASGANPLPSSGVAAGKDTSNS